jgi:tight adherence protein B
VVKGESYVSPDRGFGVMIYATLFLLFCVVLAPLSLLRSDLPIKFRQIFTSGLPARATRFLMAVRSERRRRLICSELPSVCDLLASILKGGGGFRTALQILHQGYRGPALKGSIASLSESLRLGTPQDEALRRWASQLGIQEAYFFAFCVNVSQRTGGRLAEALERLSGSLRAQQAVTLKAEALTSQGRLQALLMAAMPFLLLLLLSAIDQSFLSFFTGSTHGIGLLGLVVLLEIVGLMWIRRIIRIEA